MRTNYILNNAIEKNEALATYLFKKIENEENISKLNSGKFKEWALYKGLSYFIIPVICGSCMITALAYSQLSVMVPLLGATPLSVLLSVDGINYYKNNYSLNNPAKVAMRIKLTHDDFLEFSKYIEQKDLSEIVKIQSDTHSLMNSQDLVSAVEEKTSKKINISKKDKKLDNYVSSLYIEKNEEIEKK